MTDILDTLSNGPTVELKIYEVKRGHWEQFLHDWRNIVRLRESAGFKIEFAVADVPGGRFIWGVSYDGNFAERNLDYLGTPDRISANRISDHISRFEIPKVLHIPLEMTD